MTAADVAQRTALDRIADKELLRADAYVGGAWTAGEAGRFAVVNPSNRETLAEVASLSAGQAAKAVEAAAGAFEAWRKTSPFERAAKLADWAAEVDAARDDLAVLITAEMGKPLMEARGEAAYALSFIDWSAEEAKRIAGETLASPFENARTFAFRAPVGVAAAITPWNFPAAMITRKVAPALAAGCAVVVKPAPETPLTALALAALAERAGLPPGLFNVVTGEAETVGPAITTHPLTRMIAFTGSTEVGKLLMRQAAEGVRKVALELGGDAPFLVLEDADVEAAAEGVLASKFRCSGQTCVSANRVIAVDAVADRLIAALADKIGALTPGDGFDPHVDQGPLIHDAALARAEETVRLAQSDGGKLVVGGHALPDLGPGFFAPTLIDLSAPPKSLRGREIFGPVAPVIRVRDEAEAVRVANDTPYGLAAYAYARDVGRVMRVIEDLDYGMVGVNVGKVSHASAPFGGVKQSGLGREGGKFGVEEFLEIKYAVIGGLAS